MGSFHQLQDLGIAQFVRSVIRVRVVEAPWAYVPTGKPPPADVSQPAASASGWRCRPLGKKQTTRQRQRRRGMPPACRQTEKRFPGHAIENRTGDGKVRISAGQRLRRLPPRSAPVVSATEDTGVPPAVTPSLTGRCRRGKRKDSRETAHSAYQIGQYDDRVPTASFGGAEQGPGTASGAPLSPAGRRTHRHIERHGDGEGQHHGAEIAPRISPSDSPAATPAGEGEEDHHEGAMEMAASSWPAPRCGHQAVQSPDRPAVQGRPAKRITRRQRSDPSRRSGDSMFRRCAMMMPAA